MNSCMTKLGTPYIAIWSAPQAGHMLREVLVLIMGGKVATHSYRRYAITHSYRSHVIGQLYRCRSIARVYLPSYLSVGAMLHGNLNFKY
jgi:hypothetical protein